MEKQTNKQKTFTQHHVFKQKKKIQGLENILQRTTSVPLLALEFLCCCPALRNKFTWRWMILQGLHFSRITKWAHGIEYSTDSHSMSASAPKQTFVKWGNGDCKLLCKVDLEKSLLYKLEILPQSVSIISFLVKKAKCPWISSQATKSPPWKLRTQHWAY